jgi:EpsI family protein
MRSLRLWIVAGLMCFAAVVLHVRGDVDHAPDARPLNEMPSTINSRTSTEVPLDEETLAILGNGFYLNRVYSLDHVNLGLTAGQRADIGLFIAYLPSQRSGQSIHSPQNCLPGAGWAIESSQVTHFSDGNGKEYEANDNLISNGSSTQEVLYWYQLHGRSIASDYRAKIDTLADSIRKGRTDEALVRIITQVVPGEGRDAARARAVDFAQQVVAMLPAYVPN